MINIADKYCFGCKMTKELSNFCKDRRTKDGLNCYCRDCRKIKGLEYANLPLDPMPEIKICTVCKIGKPPIEFGKDRRSKDGLTRLCKDCQKIKYEEYAIFPCDPIPDMKVCKKCKMWKSPKDFRKSKGGRDGLNRICRNCARSESLKISYGITLEEYNKILELQNEVCAIRSS